MAITVGLQPRGAENAQDLGGSSQLAVEAQQASPGGVVGADAADAVLLPSSGSDPVDGRDARRVPVRSADALLIPHTGGNDTGPRLKVDARGSELTCPNRFDVEPMVSYDLSGASLAGIQHQRLSVYSNGMASISALQPGQSQPVVALKYLDVVDATALQADLVAAGADSLCDEDTTVVNAPLATVTVFHADGSAHSFNYFPAGGGAEWQPVEDVIQDFMHANFPEAFEATKN